MSDIALDTDGDIKITNNQVLLNEGAEAIRQHLLTRFQLFFGEWFLDITEGVPWYQDILIKKPAFSVVQEILKDVILDTPGVLELRSFNLDFTAQTRQLSLTFQALTTSGFIDFSEVIGVTQ